MFQNITDLLFHQLNIPFVWKNGINVNVAEFLAYGIFHLRMYLILMLTFNVNYRLS